MKLSIRSPFKVAYHTGERLSLYGLEVMACYSDGNTKIVTEQCKYSPASGVSLAYNEISHSEKAILSCNSPSGFENFNERAITITYEETNEETNRVERVSTSFPISVSDNFTQLIVVSSDKVPTTHSKGEYLPVSKLTVVFNNGQKSFDIFHEFYQYFLDFPTGRLTEEGEIELKATYTHLDGTTRTGSITVDVKPPYIKSIIPITSAIKPVYAGQNFNYQSLSVKWIRSDNGVPGSSTAETQGILSWDSGKISIDRTSLTAYNDRKITVGIVGESATASFDLEWKARAVGFNSTISTLTVWYNTSKNDLGLKFNSLVFDDGTIVEDDWNSMPKNIVSISRGISVGGGANSIEVEENQISSIINVFPYVSAKYDDGFISVLSIGAEASAYAKATTLNFEGEPLTSYMESEVFDPSGLSFQVSFDSGLEKDLTLDEVVYSKDPLKYIGSQLTKFMFSYVQRIENGDNVLESSTNTVLQIKVDMKLPVAVSMKEPTERYGGFHLGDNDFLIDGTPVLLDLEYENGYHAEHALSAIIDSSVEYYSIFPDHIYEIGDYDLTIEYVIDTERETKNFELSPYMVRVDYCEEGNQLSVCKQPTTFSYYEGQLFDPTGLSVDMVFGNGHRMDVTDKLRYSDDLCCTYEPIERSASSVTARYTLSAIRGEEEYTVEIPIGTTNMLIFTPMDDEEKLGVRINPEYPVEMIPSVIEIPSYINEPGLSGEVVEIQNYGFANLTNVFQIIIPETVTRIGEGAFAGCARLASTGLSDTVDLSRMEYIGPSAFYGCAGMQNVILPETEEYTQIESGTFMNSGIRYVDMLSSNISCIGVSAFGGCCNLTSIYIPAIVSTISSHAFAECAALEEATLFQDEIPDGCFKGCRSLANLSLPDNLSSIGASAFYGCGMRIVSIPENIVTMGDSAFEKCENMGSLVLFSQFIGNIGDEGDATLKYVGENAFAFTDSQELKRNVIFAYISQEQIEATEIYRQSDNFNRWTNSNPKIIIRDSEYAANLKYEVEILDENSVKIVWVIEDMLVPNTVIPERILWENDDGEEHEYQVVELGDNLFANIENISSVTIPSTVTVVGNKAFYGCENLVEVLGGQNIDNLGKEAFANCHNLSVCEVASRNIGEQAFENCERLVSLNVAKTLTFGENAFEGCDSLSNIEINGTKPVSEIFPQYASIAKITVTRNGSSNYLVDSLFANCTSLTSLEIDDELSVWHSRLFDNCISLSTVNFMPDLSYEEDTFAGSHFTQEIYMKYDTTNDTGILIHVPDAVAVSGEYTLPDAALSVGKFAIHGTTEIMKLIVPALSNDSLRFLDEKAVFDNPGLEEVEITATDIQYKDQEARIYSEQILAGNTSLTSFRSYLWNAATPYMLSGCSSLENVELFYETEDENSNYLIIGEHSFAYSGLKSVSLTNENLIEVETGAFAGGQLTAFHINSIPIYGVNVFGQENNLQLVEMPLGLAINLKNVIGTNVISAIINADGNPITYGNVNSVLNMRELSLINCSVLSASDDGGALQGLASLSSVTFVESCPRNLGTKCFYGDVSLETITLSSVSNIGEGCFGNCTSLSSIIFFGQIPTFAKNGTADTKVFDTGGNNLSVILGNDMYIDNWNAKLSEKITSSLATKTIPATWERTDRNPAIVEFMLSGDVEEDSSSQSDQLGENVV